MPSITNCLNWFKKTKTPQEILTDLAKNETGLKKDKIRLEMDYKKANQEVDLAISKATKAQTEGDSIGVKAAVAEFTGARMVSAQVVRERLLNIKSLSLLTVARRKIEQTVRSKESNQLSLQQVLESLNSPRVQELLSDHEITLQNFEKELEVMAQMASENAQVVAGVEPPSEDELLIQELVKAQQSGDVKTATQLKARLAGENLQAQAS